MRIVAALALLAVAAQENYFPTKAGTCWTYSVTDSTDKDSTAKEETAEVSSATTARGAWAEVDHFLGHEKAYLKSDANGVLLRLEAPTAEDETGLRILKVSLKIGDSWSGKLTDREESRFTVEAEEDLKVEAGQFRCFRIGMELEERAKKSDVHTSKGTFWFAPGTGIVKATISHDLDIHTTSTKTYTLKKFEQR